MPSSAALMRKTLRSILQEKIIPGLSGKENPLIALAQIPPQAPPGIVVRERKGPVLKTADVRPSPHSGDVWERSRMTAHPIPELYYVVDGVYDATVGVTDSMLPRKVRKSGGKQPGSYVFTVPEGAFFLRPAHVPLPMDPSPDFFQKKLSYVTIRPLSGGVLCNVVEVQGENTEIAYSLLVDDDHLAPLADVLINELKQTPVDLQIVKALLLSFMLRLERAMSARIPPMMDGLYSRFPNTSPPSKIGQPVDDPLVHKIHAYIRQHLHQPLTPADIAAHVRLSPSQVNRVLRQHTGMSIMAYTTHQRMETAQLLLDTSAQSVEEIARLVGFQRVSHFSNTFRHFHGVSPLKFRQLHPPSPYSARWSNVTGRHPNDSRGRENESQAEGPNHK